MDKFCGSVFWDSNLTWHTESPDFTVCFQKTVLSSIPICFLWLFSPLDIYLTQSLPSKSSRIPWGPLNLAKLGFSMLLCVLEVVLFLISLQLNPYNYPVDIYVPLLRVTTLLLALGLLVYSKQKGMTSSGTQFIFWLLTTLIQAFRFRTVLLQTQQNLDPVSYSLEICYFPVCVGQLFLHCWADHNTEYSEITEKSQPSPETTCSFLSKLVFEWYTPITWIGNKRPLEYSDLYSLIPQLTTYQALPKFDRHWRPTLQNPGSVFTTWLKGFGLHYFLTFLLRVIPDFMIFVLPVVLHLLITFVSTPEESTWHGILYAVILLFNGLFSVIITANAVHLFNYNGLSFNTCLVNNIYRKALRLSATSRRTRSTGEIINHMGVDCAYICGTILTGNIILSTPILVIVALVFLWNILGFAALAGVGAMLLLLPVNAWIASRVQKLQKTQMVYKDKRIKLMNEILSSIKVLKLYAWEPSFMKDVMKIRSLELAQLRRAQYWNAVANFLAGCAPFFVAFVSFATFVSVSDSVLDAQTAFVALALFNIMSMPMAFLPLLISNTIQASVAIKRVNGYLNAEELEKIPADHISGEGHVTIANGTFLWDRNSEEILSDINFNVNQGQLVSIVGVVGSGKSSLLMALLNEMVRKEGNVTVNGSVAYVAQNAWIQNATVRDNILFGKPYEPIRYNKVVKACALQPDLQILPGGDNTELGEKGINLSGGQKQRIALARAVYHDADIYLLDDPLSAVDAHVGRHLIDNVIGRNGLLKKKTRILVTHGVVYLPIMDNIYVMDGGKIREEGSYKELIDRQGLFCDFIKEHGGQEERRESVDKSIEQSHTEQKPTNIPEQKKLIEDEKLQTSNVKGSVYLEYIKAAGLMLTATIFILYLTFQGFSIGATLWLAYWTDLSGNLTANEFQADTIYFLGVYSALGACQAICILTASLILAVASVRAADRLHYQLLNRIIRAPLQFFDVTPMGRILNRFTKDVSSLDEILPVILKYLINGIFTVIAVTVVISFTTPVFIIVMIPIGILYVFIQRFYIKTSRQVKRIDSASKSPVFSHFAETITGAITIRAFKAEERFIQELERRQDYSVVPYYASVTANRWLQIRLEMVSSLVVFFAALFAVIGRDSISEGLVGLSISYALQVTVALVTLVRFISEVETNIVAVERMKEYYECPQEAPWDVGRDLGDWPNSGAVEFSSFKARYREGLDLVLKGVDCKIQGGEKIGIVGRTGAGKSSVTLGLFRILEAAGGKIVIDGEDIGCLGLHDIRGKIGIIPQEPVLFDGTLRKNLDPCGEYSDELLWRSLELAHLKNWVLGMEGGLAFDVAEGGENMSVGQRQLVCLARTILKKSKILVLDEATSAVDLETEELILKTIREEFQDSTVLTIAHRLNTIMDSDRVIVLDSGEIKEFDTPKKLLSDCCSLFHGMAKQAGIIKK